MSNTSKPMLPTFSRWLSNVKFSNRGFPTVTVGSTWKLVPLWSWGRLGLQQQALQRVISASIANQLEPAIMIRNLAEEQRGSYRRTLRRLARRLDSGTPLAAALEQTPGALSREVVLAIQFGSQTGTLRESAAQSLAAEQQDCEAVQPIHEYMWYLLTLGLIVLFLAVAIASFFFPGFKFIADEYGMRDPFGAMDPIVRFAYANKHSGPLFVLVLFVLVMIFGAPLVRKLAFPIVQKLFARPVHVARQARVLELMAVGLGAGRPLPASLSTLARYHFDKSLRMKLLEVRNNVEQGADVYESLRDSGILTAQEAAAIQASRSSAVASWALNAFAQRRRTQIASLIESASAVAMPASVLLLGAVVFSVWWVVFGFLVQLTTSLT